MRSIEIILTDSTNSDFQALSSEMETEFPKSGRELSKSNANFNQMNYLPNILVAFAESTPVGYSGFRQYNMNTAEIMQVFVIPSHRRFHIASKILAELESLAKELLFKYCLFETRSNNTEAISFFSKNGYSAPKNLSNCEGSHDTIRFTKRI